MLTEPKAAPAKGKTKPETDRSSFTQGRRSLPYDSADSSDSGVGVESAVWSPCSSLSYSPPPSLSDPDDDDLSLSEGCPPPSPPQSSPPSPGEPRELRSPSRGNEPGCRRTRMAPNDGSGARIVRKGPAAVVDAERLMGRCSLPAGVEATPHQAVVAPRKDRPPDGAPLSPRTRRMTSIGGPPRSPRKRGTDGPRYDSERRTKTLRGPPDNFSHRVNGIAKLNGEIVNEPALLARLAGLTGAAEEGRRSARVRCGLGGGQPNSTKRSEVVNSAINGRLNGIHRQVETKLKDINRTINNNVSSRNNNIESDLPLLITPPPAPCLPPASLASSRLSTSSSCSSSSGFGSSVGGGGDASSSASNSGTTTPTPTPKVRFPPPQKKDPGDTCRWRGCSATMDEGSSLLEHIQAVHVEGQLEAESFRCLWVGCKVFDRASCSVSWLERHVLTHGGHKPFKCIVDGCGHRFTSQNALGRHVNHHFNSPTPAPAPKPANHNASSPTKLIRKNGRKFRYRKRPWSARIFDFFDLSTMEHIRWSILRANEAQQQISSPYSSTSSHCDAIKFSPRVIGRRKSVSGETETLVRWSPPGILPDEWTISGDEICDRSVALSELSHEGKLAAGQLCFPPDCAPLPRPHNRRKRNERKPTRGLDDVAATAAARS